MNIPTILPTKLRLVLMYSVFPFVFALSNTAQAGESPLSKILELPTILENQEMRIIEVQLAPGEASPPHRHNAHVYVYMLEGEVEMQVKGGALKRLKPGDTFYESPEDIHQVGRNVSSTESARFLVHMIKEVGAPATVLVD